MEVGVLKSDAFVKVAAVRFDDAHDYPRWLLSDTRHALLFLVSAHSVLHVYDLHSAKLLYKQRLPGTCVAAACVGDVGAPATKTDANGELSGIVTLDSRGRVTHIAVNDANIVAHCRDVLHDVELANAMSQRSAAALCCCWSLV